MNQAARIKKVSNSMERAKLIHDAALKIITIEAELEQAYESAGGDWDQGVEELSNLLEQDD